MPKNVPPAILSAIAEGRAILFLGAGASYDALVAGKPTRVTADKVKSAISDKWLGGGYKDRPLMTVADFGRNEASLAEVQSLINDLFKDLEPNSFHSLVPHFRWKAIVTTNYDLVVERAYKKATGALQRLAPITKDGPQLQDALTEQNTLPYLKLHGCINNFNDTYIPIILDSLEYSKFTGGRAGLVTAFKEWAINSPIIFCGYSLSDENIKQILFDIGDTSQVRPQYLYVSPGLTEIEERYWNVRRIAPFSGTYAELLSLVDGIIPPATRVLSALISPDAPSITKWIPSHSSPSPGLLQYLREEVKHVLPAALATGKADPGRFFAGLDVGFDPIYAGLDVRRQPVDVLLGQVVLDTLKSTLPKFFVLRGYAGCGKSVLARRLAIEAAGLLDSPLVIYLSEGSVLRTHYLLELQQLVQARLYIFLDDLIEYQDSLPPFLDNLRAKEVPITVFACARTNELSAYGSAYSNRITADFELGDLEEAEIEQLLERLSANKLLGPLKNYDESERGILIERFYGRQLLVALHEITRGRPFEDIIIDEFEKITPREAQQVYLDICTLHQCRVGVRAGLISRLSGLPIESLNIYLAGALANVVREGFDHRYRDTVYRSRHEEIAKMVFDLAIPSAEQRAFQLQRILSNMDLDYSSDSTAFFELLKGRRLADEFEHKGLALAIFDAAEGAHPPPSYLLHQRAILELNHKHGNLETANELLRSAENAAREEGYRDASIQHTRANLLRKKANTSRQAVERERFRAEARGILRLQIGQRKNSYPEVLYGQLLLDEMRDAFEYNGVNPSTAPSDPQVRLVNELSNLLDTSLRDHPTDAPMTLLKAEFLKTLGKSPNAVSLLESYCKKNQTNSLIVKVLAEALIEADRIDDAIDILRPPLFAAPSEKPINMVMAKALMAKGEHENAESILGHLRHSFSDGDTNYEARLLFARCNMLYGDLDRGRAEFESLRKRYFGNREGAVALVRNLDGVPRRYFGRVARKQFGYGFITSNDLRFDVFFHRNHAVGDLWDRLDRGVSVSFLLAFSFRGPVPIAIEKM